MAVSRKPRRCYVTHIMECPCLFASKFQHMQDYYVELMNEWQRVEMEVAAYDEFDTDDFTVVALPFSINLSIPNTQEGFTDYSFMSEDCFHFSQKGNARGRKVNSYFWLLICTCWIFITSLFACYCKLCYPMTISKRSFCCVTFVSIFFSCERYLEQSSWTSWG